MMKKQYIILLIALLCLFNQLAVAQLPPVNFPSNKVACDATPWKLIVFDDFNGNALNTTKWFPFNTNNWDDHDNWCGARLGYPGNYTIHRDENVIVNNGTLKLTVEQKTNTWQCASCNPTTCLEPGWGDVPRTENFTSGYISSKLRFNNGKVETRVKMPNHKNSWGTIWFWLGTNTNEIDIAEAWGGTYGAVGELQRPRNTWSTHAWATDSVRLNYGVQNAQITDRFPNQNWWQWLWGNKKYLRQEEWHDYTMEWDTAVIKFYFDNELNKTIWKYYKTEMVPSWNGTNWVWYAVKNPSGCLITPGDWKITEGFPYIKNSHCKLIFSLGQTSRDKIKSTDGHVGQMEVDYVKVYQRHPENDGHISICSNFSPVIVGPNTICSGTGYSLSFPAPGGTWSLSNTGLTFGGGTGGASVLLERNPYSTDPTTTLTYTYTPAEGCPPVKITKVINTGIIYPNVGVVRTWTPFWQRFSLFGDPAITGATYLWKVWYGNTGPTNYYEGTGPFITTPQTGNGLFLASYYLRWELKVVTSCGSAVVTGLRSNLPFVTPMLANPDTYMMKDSSAIFLEAKFDTQTEIDKYEQTVTSLIGNEFVEDLNDTLSINTMIERIKLQALEPYLYFGDREEEIMTISKNLNVDIDVCKVYPNPTSKSLSVTLSKAFDAKSLTQYVISNLTGKNISKGTLKGDIDVSALPPGIYVLELQQGELREYLKFVRE